MSRFDFGASESKVIVKIPASAAWLIVGVSALASMAETASPSTLRETASSIIRFWSGICAFCGPDHEASHPNFAFARSMPTPIGSQNGEMPLVMMAILTFCPDEAPEGGAADVLAGPPGGGALDCWPPPLQEVSERPPARSSRPANVRRKRA